MSGIRMRENDELVDIECEKIVEQRKEATNPLPSKKKKTRTADIKRRLLASFAKWGYTIDDARIECADK